MSTSEQSRIRDVERIGAPPGSRGGEPNGSSGRMVVRGIVIAVVLMVITGISVYAWQQGEIRERNAALAVALQERNAARQEADALRADAGLSAAEVQALEAQVGQLRGRVERLQAAVDDLSVPGATTSCSAADILAAIRAQVLIATPMVWDSVSIQECRAGYAWVLAHPGNIPAGSNVEESEQVFLRNEGGEWIVIASGTGISCSDPDLFPDLEQACSELGLS